MADPLSISASIIALMQLSQAVVGYLRVIRDKDSPRLRSTLRSTEGILETLRETIEDARSEPSETWSKTIRNLDDEEGPLRQLSTVLSSVNAILQKHASGPRRLLWPFKRDQVDEFVKSIESQKLLLALALENDHVALSKAIHRDTKEIRDGVGKLRDAQVSCERRELLDWLSALDFTSQLHDFLGKREEGSGQWFLKSQEYKSWLAEAGKTLLCPGLPGAGKTIMASIAIEHLVDNYRNDEAKHQNVGVAYVFCNYQAQKVQGVGDLLSCLLKQLVQQTPDIPDAVTDLYETSVERGIRPSLEDIGKALRSTALLLDRLFIVVDALDEYYVTDKESLSRLLSVLFELQRDSSANILATSRFNSEVTCQFPTGVLVKEIRADDEDVSRYINSRIPHLLSSRIARHPEMMQSIRQEVLKRVDGMFLLSRLHMDALASQPSIGHIKKTLRDLPKGLGGLDQTYENALQRIENQPPEQRGLAKKVLCWTYGAKRVLSTAELQHAVAVDPDMADLDRDFLPDVESLDALCAGLVTVDREMNVVRLVHYTTQEFFERHEFLRGSNLLLARTCITYLSFHQFSLGVSETPSAFEERLSDYELFIYAATHWGDHLRDHAESEKQDTEPLTEVALAFLRKPELVDSAFQALLYSDESETARRRLWQPPRMTGLHLVAYLGLDFLTGSLCRQGQGTGARDARGLTPLSWAALKGHSGVLASLLGALGQANDINITDNNGRTAFFHAVMEGQWDAANLLLEHGADPNLSDYGEDSPLVYATRKHRLRAVEYLLTVPSVKLSDTNRRSLPPLVVALREEDFRIAKVLIDAGASLGDRSGELGRTNAAGETYLHIVAKIGSVAESTMGHLIAAGADLEGRDEQGRTPLLAAAANGSVRAVRILVAAGADVRAVDGGGRTALTLAISRRCLPMVRDPVAAGSTDVISALMLCASMPPPFDAYGSCDSDSLDDDGDDSRSPQPALIVPDPRALIARVLLAAGADADKRDAAGNTAVNWAAARGDADMLEVLLQHGADAGHRDGAHGRTPLAAAILAGSVAAVRVLLAHGAEVDDTAKLAVIDGECVEMVGLLLPAYGAFAVTTERVTLASPTAPRAMAASGPGGLLDWRSILPDDDDDSSVPEMFELAQRSVRPPPPPPQASKSTATT